MALARIVATAEEVCRVEICSSADARARHERLPHARATSPRVCRPTPRASTAAADTRRRRRAAVAWSAFSCWARRGSRRMYISTNQGLRSLSSRTIVDRRLRESPSTGGGTAESISLAPAPPTTSGPRRAFPARLADERVDAAGDDQNSRPGPTPRPSSDATSSSRQHCRRHRRRNNGPVRVAVAPNSRCHHHS